MATSESVKNKINGLITQANGVTKRTDTNLTDAVGALIEGYGTSEAVDFMVQGGYDADGFDYSSSTITTVRPYAFQNVAVKNVNLPNVTTLGKYAFDNSYLVSINIPSVTSIETYTFNRCMNLKSVIATNASGTLYSNAFYYCRALEEINLPLVTTLQSSTFDNCASLKKADFGAVTSIGGNAFTNATAMVTLILRSSTMATMSSTSAFYNSGIGNGTGYIYVPAALIDSYKTATNWSTYADQFRAIEDYPDICG